MKFRHRLLEGLKVPRPHSVRPQQSKYYKQQKISVSAPDGHGPGTLSQYSGAVGTPVPPSGGRDVLSVVVVVVFTFPQKDI